MTNWPTFPLAELCKINIGRTPARNRPEYWSPGSPWLSIADMNQGRLLSTTKEEISPAAAAAMGTPVQPGTVALSFKLSVGKVGIIGVPMYTNEAIATLPIRNPGLLSHDFLYWSLRNIDVAANADRAAMGQTLNKAKLAEIRVPVPPLHEQRRIVEILDCAEELHLSRRKTLDYIDELARSLFLNTFGDPIVNRNGWPAMELREIGTVTTGNTPPRANKSNFGNEIEWIKSDNIDPAHEFLTTAAESLSFTGKKIARTAGPGALLVTCIAGSPSSIGNVAIADREVAFNQQINALTPSEADIWFMYVQLKVGKRLIQDKSTGGMKGLVSKSRFGSIRAIFPPLDLQRQFGSTMERIVRLKRAMAIHVSELRALQMTLQHRAFRGEL